LGKIRVHEKALAHLSRGLYRSPASALRELVSNAWDANAKTVRIDMGAPNFPQISVQDDGEGFTREEFVRLMEGGIGNSEKRVISKTLTNGRPMIGRLGIGMLGIAQISGGFIVTSKPKKGEGFSASVRLYDLIRPRLDRDDKDIVRTAKEGVSEVDVGEYQILKEFDPSRYKIGTTIITNDPHPVFVQSFRESYQEPPSDWVAFIRRSAKVATIQELGDYWRLLWELAASCPLPYVGPNAVPGRLATEDHERLQHFGFRVLVDGLELRKPIRLTGNKAGYTTHKIERTTERVFGREVSFHGYMVVQEGKQITPDELRGIMIRIRQVGVGLYDHSLLDYRYNEGPRSRWITGEVYADEGLEDALNIDRDSFNRFNPEFRLVQKQVHQALQEVVFPSVYKEIEVRSEARRKTSDLERTRVIREVLAGDDGLEVKVREAKALGPDEVLAKTIVRKSGKRLEVDLPPPDAMLTKKPNRRLASAILAIYDVSQKEGNPDRRRSTFIQRLLALLAKW
jgi:hypothetical protein